MVELDSSLLSEPEILAGVRQDLCFHDPELAGVVRAMAHEVESGCPHGSLFAETISVGVLLRLARTHGKTPRERGELTAAQMRRIDELIADTPATGVTLGALADSAGYSKAHFVRLFRRSTGESTHRYVLRRRLERARHLVVATSLPLAHVASETNFASQSHFQNAFLRHFGCTPGEARRESGR